MVPSCLLATWNRLRFGLSLAVGRDATTVVRFSAAKDVSCQQCLLSLPSPAYSSSLGQIVQLTPGTQVRAVSVDAFLVFKGKVRAGRSQVVLFCFRSFASFVALQFNGDRDCIVGVYGVGNRGVSFFGRDSRETVGLTRELPLCRYMADITKIVLDHLYSILTGKNRFLLKRISSLLNA